MKYIMIDIIERVIIINISETVTERRKERALLVNGARYARTGRQRARYARTRATESALRATGTLQRATRERGV